MTRPQILDERTSERLCMDVLAYTDLANRPCYHNDSETRQLFERRATEARAELARRHVRAFTIGATI